MRINKAKSWFYGNTQLEISMRERRKTKINTIRNGKGTDLQRLKR